MNTSRRSFLKQAGTASALLGMAPLASCFESSTAKSPQWGLILNTVKHEMAEDYVRTLEQIAEMGYTWIEGGSYGDSVDAYGKLLTSLGLKAVSTGSSMDSLQNKLDDYLQRAHALGCEYIACYWPWLSDAKNLSKDECLQTAENLNELGRKVKREGLRLSWHNHDKEFWPLPDGSFPFDWLMNETDPDYVCGQMDLYWVRKGGQQPVEFIKKHPGRFEMFHVKDMVQEESEEIACVGAGRIDFQEIFDLAEVAGLRYPIVENERATQGIACARGSISHLHSLKM